MPGCRHFRNDDPAPPLWCSATLTHRLARIANDAQGPPTMHVEVAPLLRSHSHTATGRKLGPLNGLDTQEISLAFVYSAARGHCVTRDLVSFTDFVNLMYACTDSKPEYGTRRRRGQYQTVGHHSEVKLQTAEVVQLWGGWMTMQHLLILAS
jgi:hypothetical protein